MIVENILKEDMSLKYNQALKLQSQNEKDEEILKRIPIESENLLKEYKEKHLHLIKRKDTEINSLEEQIQEYEQKIKQSEQIISKLPKYIKKIYKI